MAEHRSRLPIEVDLKKLPRWACVAFAARCARRVQPLYAAWKGAAIEHVGAVDRAVSLAESSATAGRAEGSAANVIANAATAAANAAYSAPDPTDTASPGHVATAAYSAVTSTYLHFAANAEMTAYQAVRAAATAPAFGFASATLAAMWTDYDTLVALARKRKWTDKSPVDPDLLGPLWPKDRPPWAAIGPAIADVPQLTIEIEPGDATPEMIADYLEALDDLFHACGGVKLSFKREGCRLFATAEVPL